ncbi:DNA topoisomerase IB [Nocardioides massiliensis]|uniref:DNA topoisomerase n=1 Tax=Nocardioides massiliensis TaxID=1325935 RepID=A0ABT9NP08_9ACTN|nr:DNA topoisomerase IB [Nocardioides massiliensis]MDP9822154.1 DNA topoisomerase IB [Nocardioides massiliensis]
MAGDLHAMVRLRTVSANSKGWTRRRAGRGFVYLDADGTRLPPEAVERIRALVIPPAWQDVWICPHANGHLQAVGTDAAGRRQYLYHPEWRVRRDLAKHERVAKVARRLPAAREAIALHLALQGMPRDRAAAAAVRLLDLGYFRIGSDSYTDSFGLTTLRREHVRRRNGALVFQFVGKSGIEHRVEIDDLPAVEAVEVMRRRRGGDDRLLAYKDGRRWGPLDGPSVNSYLREIVGDEITAKDFRTWHATVLAAAALAASDEHGESAASRKRAIRGAMVEVAEYLGNTPTVARNSYVDPAVIDLYEDGVTIEAALRRAPEDPALRQAALERATLRLLKQAPEALRRRARRIG